MKYNPPAPIASEPIDIVPPYGRYNVYLAPDLTKGGIDVTTVETERLIRWLIQHGHTYEEAYECIAFMAGKLES